MIVKAEMDKKKQQQISTYSSTVEIEVAGYAKITSRIKEIEEKKTQTQHYPKEEELLSSTENSDNHNRKLRSCLRSRIVRLFKDPDRRDNFTIPQVLASIDMLIMFVATTCRIGSTLTAIDNMVQIGKALGYTQQN